LPSSGFFPVCPIRREGGPFPRRHGSLPCFSWIRWVARHSSLLFPRRSERTVFAKPPIRFHIIAQLCFGGNGGIPLQDGGHSRDAVSGFFLEGIDGPENRRDPVSGRPVGEPVPFFRRKHFLQPFFNRKRRPAFDDATAGKIALFYPAVSEGNLAAEPRAPDQQIVISLHNAYLFSPRPRGRPPLSAGRPLGLIPAAVSPRAECNSRVRVGEIAPPWSGHDQYLPRACCS